MQGVARALVLLGLLSVGCAHKVHPTTPSVPNRFETVTFRDELVKFNDIYAQWSRVYFGCPTKTHVASDCVMGAGVLDLKGYKELTELSTKVFPVRRERK